WPTSLFPICPSGSPTANPDALSNVRGYRDQILFQLGALASVIAFPSRASRSPQPSSTTSTTGRLSTANILVVSPCSYMVKRSRSDKCMPASRSIPAMYRAISALVAIAAATTVAVTFLRGDSAEASATVVAQVAEQLTPISSATVHSAPGGAQFATIDKGSL